MTCTDRFPAPRVRRSRRAATFGAVAHELTPRSDVLLSTAEVERLLRAEFAHVRSDADAGARAARALADRLERASPRAFFGRAEQVLAYAARLRVLPVGDVLEIHFGDTEHDALRVVVMPGERLRFGYGSTEEEQAARPLIERCARVLECDIDVI